MNSEKIQEILSNLVGRENTSEIRKKLIGDISQFVGDYPIIVCDETNNTEYDISNNQIVVDCYRGDRSKWVNFRMFPA